MSTEVATQQEAFKANGFQVIEVGAMGPVAMFNTALITEKTLGIMHLVLSEGGFDDIGHGLHSIVLRDDGRPCDNEGFNSWMFYPNSRAAVCNLQDCVELAISTTQDEKKEFTECINVKALVWKNIIQGFAHEAHHAYSFLQEDKLWNDEEAKAAEEEKAEEFARALMFKLAKMTDLEMEFTPEVFEIIDIFLTEELEAVDKKGDKAPAHLVRWAKLQRKMLSTGAVYYDPAEDAKDVDMVLKTFKEFLHWCSGDAEDDAEWATPTIATQLELVQQDHGEAAGGQPATVTATTTEVIPFDPDEDMIDDYIDDDDDGIVVDATPGFQGVAQVTQPGAQPVQPVYQQNTPVYTAPAAQAAPANVQVGANMYSPITLPAGVDAKTVVYGLYVKIFAQIFQGCQYNPTLPAGAFNAPQNIKAHVPLDQNEALFVKDMTIDNGQGGITTQPVQGAIIGRMIDKAGTLPAFELGLQTIDGQHIKRKFIPQNPNKMNNGALTATAQLAKQGHQIMWIMDTDTKNFNVRVYNGVVQQNVNGQWV